MGRTAALLAEQAEAFDTSVVSATATHLAVEVRLFRADGAVVPYTLEVDASSPQVKVREAKPARLPAACPERHVNWDGSFCTHWQAVDPILVTDAESAEHWWKQLLAYLRLQERATKLRRWPSPRQWAHGDAADHQLVAETAAAALGPNLQNALAAGTLRVKKSKGGAFLALWDGPRRLYSVWRDARRVATLRQPCLCGARRAIRDCQDHADRAADLVFSLLDVEREERRFWNARAGQACCGTLDNCPLARPLAAAA